MMDARLVNAFQLISIEFTGTVFIAIQFSLNHPAQPPNYLLRLNSLLMAFLPNFRLKSTFAL